MFHVASIIREQRDMYLLENLGIMRLAKGFLLNNIVNNMRCRSCDTIGSVSRLSFIPKFVCVSVCILASLGDSAHAEALN